VFIAKDGTGTAVLLAFGGLLLVFALLGDRIESLEFGGAKLRLRAAAAERFARAEESERLGDTAGADRLRAEAQALMAAAGSIAADYRAIRGSMRAGRDRTQALDEVVARAGRLAGEQTFEPAEVARWLRGGSPEERVTALGMMQARPELRDFPAVRAAIEHPSSPFEQFHSLRLAIEMLDDLDLSQRQQLVHTVKKARGLRFRADATRWQLSQEILRRLG
jgi:hypothetical protein